MFWCGDCFLVCGGDCFYLLYLDCVVDVVYYVDVFGVGGEGQGEVIVYGVVWWFIFLFLVVIG